MQAWMIYRKPDADHNKHYIAEYQEVGARYGLEIKIIYADYVDFGARQDGEPYLTYYNEPIVLPRLAIMRINHTLLNQHLEFMGVKTFNNSHVSQICNDKARTFQYLRHLGIPMLPSMFCKNEFVAWRLRTAEKPVVVKAVDGHGGNQVFLYQPQTDGDKERILIIKKLNGSDAVIQPYFETGRQDVRVYVVGQEIIAAVKRSSQHDFRANYSLGGRAEPYELKPEEEAMVQKIIRPFDAGMVGVDFLFDQEGRLILNEIEDVVGARTLYQCYRDVNIIDKYLQFISQKMEDET